MFRPDLLLLAGLLLAGPALAQPTRAAADATRLVQAGQENARFCRHCHGEAGVSVHADVPNLAGQNAAYLLDQMNKFAEGRRKDEFMEGLIKALKPQERASIALYFSQQRVLPQPVKNGAQVEEGGALYAKLCVSCHGADAHGTARFPRLAGQQRLYLQRSLERYRNGSGERIDPRMASYTRNLKQQDIVNLAAYLASLR